jgi:putative ABC transport system ATP-binding protein
VPVRLAQASVRLQRIYAIRLKIFQRKFFVKFLNNFINSLVPFFFYAIGGYLVIRGSLSFGSLVAVLAAYTDMSPRGESSSTSTKTRRIAEFATSR